MRRFLGQGILPRPAIALFGMLGMVSGLSLQAYDFTSGLVGHYLFDGNASDVSGNGNHGTISGAVPGADRNGLAGMAYVFDGTDDYISGTTWFNGLNDSTVSLWVKVSNTNSGGLLQTGSISVSYGSGAVSPSVFANRNGGPGTAYR